MKAKDRRQLALLEKILSLKPREPMMSPAEHNEQVSRYLEAKVRVVIYLHQMDYYVAPEASPGFALLKSRSLPECEAFCKARRLAFSHAVSCNPFTRCQ